MYIFTHESEALVPGTQHKVGAAHALEIRYKFYIAGQATAGSGGRCEVEARGDPPALLARPACFRRSLRFFTKKTLSNARSRSAAGQGTSRSRP